MAPVAKLEQGMCVWDGTYTAPEAEREAMEQVPGWVDDERSRGIAGIADPWSRVVHPLDDCTPEAP